LMEGYRIGKHPSSIHLAPTTLEEVNVGKGPTVGDRTDKRKHEATSQ